MLNVKRVTISGLFIVLCMSAGFLALAQNTLNLFLSSVASRWSVWGDCTAHWLTMLTSASGSREQTASWIYLSIATSSPQGYLIQYLLAAHTLTHHIIAIAVSGVSIISAFLFFTQTTALFSGAYELLNSKIYLLPFLVQLLLDCLVMWADFIMINLIPHFTTHHSQANSALTHRRTIFLFFAMALRLMFVCVIWYLNREIAEKKIRDGNMMWREVIRGAQVDDLDEVMAGDQRLWLECYDTGNGITEEHAVFDDLSRRKMLEYQC